MKQFTTPGVKATTVLLRIKRTKARKHVAKANLEAIHAKLDSERLNAKAKI